MPKPQKISRQCWILSSNITITTPRYNSKGVKNGDTIIIKKGDEIGEFWSHSELTSFLRTAWRLGAKPLKHYYSLRREKRTRLTGQLVLSPSYDGRPRRYNGHKTTPYVPNFRAAMHIKELARPPKSK